MRSIDPTEHQIQAAIVEWANNTFVDHPRGGKVRLGGYLIKITNEGKQKVFQDKNGNYFCPTGIKYNKEGRKKGASDLFLAFPVSGKIDGYHYEYYGFWLELKKKGKKPTDDQLEFLSGMLGIGYWADWKDSVDGAIQAIKDYLGVN